MRGQGSAAILASLKLCGSLCGIESTGTYNLGIMQADNSVQFFEAAKIASERGDKRYREFLRIPAMSAGIYVLAAGAEDPQSPHKEDELYYVASGCARFKAGKEDQAVGAGSVIFVAAKLEHRFYEISEDLTVLVFFAPAETS